MLPDIISDFAPYVDSEHPATAYTMSIAEIIRRYRDLPVFAVLLLMHG